PPLLGPRYASVTLGDGQPPANLLRPATLTEIADQERNDLRDRLNNRFAQTRRSADTEAYTNSYAQATQVMQRRGLFDLGQESMQMRDRYGSHDFAQTRRSADTEAYTNSYAQATQVMQRRGLFDLGQESMQMRDRYGSHDFG